jgi:hypothetical protein
MVKWADGLKHRQAGIRGEQIHFAPAEILLADLLSEAMELNPRKRKDANRAVNEGMATEIEVFPHVAAVEELQDKGTLTDAVIHGRTRQLNTVQSRAAREGGLPQLLLADTMRSPPIISILIGALAYPQTIVTTDNNGVYRPVEEDRTSTPFNADGTPIVEDAFGDNRIQWRHGNGDISSRVNEATHALRNHTADNAVTPQSLHAFNRLKRSFIDGANDASKIAIKKRICQAANQPFEQTRGDRDQQLPLYAEIVWIRPHTFPKYAYRNRDHEDPDPVGPYYPRPLPAD